MFRCDCSLGMQSRTQPQSSERSSIWDCCSVYFSRRGLRAILRSRWRLEVRRNLAFRYQDRNDALTKLLSLIVLDHGKVQSVRPIAFTAGRLRKRMQAGSGVRSARVGSM